MFLPCLNKVYVMICYVVYVMLSYVMLCYVMLCYVMLWCYVITENDDEKVCAEASNVKKWFQERSSCSFSVANCFQWVVSWDLSPPQRFKRSLYKSAVRSVPQAQSRMDRSGREPLPDVSISRTSMDFSTSNFIFSMKRSKVFYFEAPHPWNPGGGSCACCLFLLE